MYNVYYLKYFEDFDLVFLMFFFLYSFMRNFVVCFEGLMIRGYLLNFFNMMAFFVYRLLVGKVLAVYLVFLFVLDRY